MACPVGAASKKWDSVASSAPDNTELGDGSKLTTTADWLIPSAP